MNGSLISVDDRPALRFERRLPHSVERVWRAVSEPSELEAWFVAAVPWGPEAGETWEAMGQRGEITDVDPPTHLRWLWGDEIYSFQLSPDGEGCVLVFTHVFEDRTLGAQHASGWTAYFRRLDAHLDGDSLSEYDAHAGAEGVHDAYAEEFGLDPEVGRAQFAKMREAGMVP